MEVFKLRRPLSLDSRTVANLQVDNPSNTHLLRPIMDNLPLSQANQSIGSEFHSALSEFIVDVEDSKFNGMNPAVNIDDRSRLLNEWEAYALGKRSGVNLKDSAKSDLAVRIDELDQIPEISGIPVDEAVERTGHWLADTYNDRSRAVPESAYISRSNAIFQDNLGLNEQGVLKRFNLGTPSEADRYEAAVSLLASKAGRAEIVYPLQSGEKNFRWGRSRSIGREEAEELLGGDVEDILDDTTESIKTALDTVAEYLEKETGLKRPDVDSRDYIQMVHRSDLDSANLGSEVVQESIEEAVEEVDAGNASEINEKSARITSSKAGVVMPESVNSVQFMDAISESSSASNVDLAEAARKAIIGVERTKDDTGLRKYRSGETEAYSVTTIIDPFPNDYDAWTKKERINFPFHREIDTGGGLFHWKNIYDGDNGRYDSEVIRDYAGLRGTLAHEEVFEEYVDDPDEVQGDTEAYWKDLEELEAERDDLGPLQDIIEWKEEKWFNVLEYDKAGGKASDGSELARKEIDWIKDQFEQLEDELGLKKENVIAAEQKFVHSTMHPWDESAQIEGPRIGELTYGGTVDLLYEHESGETWLLDLKTGSMKPNYAVQQAAYKEAVENSEFLDVDEVDRVVIPSIDPETMMYSDKEPVIYTDRPHGSEKFNHSKFLDASEIDLESSDYRKNRWEPGNWDEEAFYIFARAAEQMEETST